MKNILLLFGLLVLLVSCSSNNDPGQIYALETMQSNALEQYAYGEEYRMEMKEMIADKSEVEVLLSRTNFIYKSFEKIDQLVGEQLSQIRAIKLGMFKAFGENIKVTSENSIVHYDYKIESPVRPLIIDLKNVKHTGRANVLTEANRKTLVNSLKAYRKTICRLVVASQSHKERCYYFVDPQINQFKDDKDFYKLFDAKTKSSNIGPDDYEAVKQIYRVLTKTDVEWEQIFTEKESWLDELAVLISIESDILRARALAFTTIRYRISDCGYNFTNILPVVYGPNAAHAGDTLELKVLMTAFNKNQNPKIDLLKMGKVTKVEDGIAYLQIVVPQSKHVEVKGRITILNKSGIPKTLPWEHEIEVIDN